MKKLISILLLLACAIGWSYAQNESTYRFNYIAHSGMSQKRALCDKLLEDYITAKENNVHCVYYLSNGSRPIVASTRDDEEQFQQIIVAIQNANSHDANVVEDASLILDVLEKYPFMDPDIDRILPQYRKVYFNFFVNSNFWNNFGNKSVISALYDALDAAHQDDILFNVHMSRLNLQEDESGNPFEWDQKFPFGEIASDHLNNDDFHFLRY